jgi:uncharacterized protein (TIGR00251 family)
VNVELREDALGVVLRVRVQPRARQEALAGTRNGALVVRIAAAPTDGRANAALSRFLGAALDVAPSRVQLLSGGSGREKRIRLVGVGRAEAERRLGLAEAGPPSGSRR